MNPQIPLLGCFAFAFWLCRRDVKTNARSVSPALWLPVLWLAIIASRPVSAWLGSGGEGADSDGDSLDRNIFLALIALGVFVLGRRRVQLTTVIRNNKWLSLFYLFFLFSVVWSPDPLVSGKRWIKDLGHVIMVLVAMTENDPIQAVRSLFLRCAYLLIPLSFVLIRYYPGIGTVYSVFTGEVHYQGVTLG